MAEYHLSQTFASLKHPNFRLWFSGQIVSLIGTWMQATAQGYLVYELTGSPVMLGIVGLPTGYQFGCSLCTRASSPTRSPGKN